MASPEMPPIPDRPPVNMKDLTTQELLGHIGAVSQQLKEDKAERTQQAKDAVMKEKILNYREKFPEESKEMTDDDIKNIIVESEERRGNVESN